MSTGATVFLGLPNIVTRGSAEVTTPGPEPVAGEASNLKDVEPRVTSRITSIIPGWSEWRLRTWGDAFDLDGVALVNTNISDHGYFRVVEANQAVITTLKANQVLSSTNARSVNSAGTPDGTIDPARLDEALTVASTTYFEPITTTSAWDALLAFPSAIVNSRPGTAMAQFLVRVKLFGTPVNVYPTLRIELRESGGLVRDLGRKAVTTAGEDQILIFPFDPSELQFPLLFSNLEIGFYGYPGDNGSYLKWNTLVVNYDSAAPTLTFDSGWVSADQTYFSSYRDGKLPTKSIHYLFGSSKPGVDFVKFMVLDDGAELNPPTSNKFGAAYNNSAAVAGLSLMPLGYIEGGVLIAGPKLDITPGVRRGSGPYMGTVTESAGGVSQAGQTFSVDAFTRRDSPQNLEIYCRREQMMELMVRVGWQKGNQEPFYVIQEPDVDLKYQVLSSFYCVCSDIQSSLVERGATREEDMFMVTMRLTEKI